MTRMTHALIGCSLLTFITASPADATSLNPGDFNVIDGVAVLEDDSFIGEIVENIKIPFSIAPDPAQGVLINGLLHQRVVRVEATGTLDFYYRVKFLSPQTIGVAGLATTGFSDLTTDVNWQSDVKGRSAPPEVWRSHDGHEVFFDFDDYFSRLHDRNSTSFVFVRTDATEYRSGGLTTIDLLIPESPERGSSPLYFGTAVVPTFEPGVPVPLPAPIFGALAGGAVCALILNNRSRRQ